MMGLRPFYYFILLSIGLYSCASQGKLPGGDEDTTPPKVVLDKSTPNRQVNFKPEKIELYFDEFVILRNVQKELIVSPPLQYLPKVENRGKKVTFTFNEDEVLKENATYAINFGKSIQDFRENNPIENYTFVFATGPVLDSLSVKGKVVEAKDGKPVKDMLIMLYDHLGDSLPYLERPFYSTRSSENGLFEINNVKSDTFKIFGLVDENVNYLYDLETEKIAYSKTPLFVNDSTLNNNINLLAFTQEAVLSVKEIIDNKPGITKVVLNKEVAQIDFDIVPSVDVISEIDKDTLLLFHKPLDSLYKSKLIIGSDTLRIRKPRPKSSIPSFSYLKSIPRSNSKVSPKDTIVWHFTTPIAGMVQDSMTLIDTLLGSRLESIDFQNRSIRFNTTPLKEGAEIKIQLLPNAVTDIFDQSNKDTLECTYTVLSRSSTGIINLDIKDLVDDSVNYIVKIQLKDKVIRQFNSMDMQDTIFTIEYLPPGKYTVHMVRDVNQNRKQDLGNYLEKSDAEEEKQLSLQALKSDWIMETKIAWEASPDKPLNNKTGDKEAPDNQPKNNVIDK